MTIIYALSSFFAVLSGCNEAVLTSCLQIDPNNPPWPAFRGYHTSVPSVLLIVHCTFAHVTPRYSFAYATMGHRLPTILGKAIDDVIETLNQESEEDRVKDLVECMERMDELKHDLEEHAKLRPIVDDGEADVALWNKEIAKYFQGELMSLQ